MGERLSYGYLENGCDGSVDPSDHPCIFIFLKKETGSRKAFDIYECCDDLADTALCFLYSDQLQRDHEGLLFSEPSVWDSCGCSDFKDRCGSADVWEEI